MNVSSSRTADPAKIRADVLVVPVPSPPGDLDGPLAAVDAALGGLLAAVIKDGEVTGKAGQVRMLHTRGDMPAARVLLAGVGADPDRAAWYHAGFRAARMCHELGARKVALLTGDEDAGDLRAMAEGLGTGGWHLHTFRTGRRGGPERPADLVVAGGGLTPRAAATAGATAHAINLARQLAETPANHMTPTILAKEAGKVAATSRTLSIEVLGPRELKQKRAGALLAVAQGSDQPPRMIVMRHRPPKAKRTTREVLGLVGKAVTFDSGGVSIKPSAGMHEMKMDMAGAAVAAAVVRAAARLRLPVAVTAVLALAENLVSGDAQRVSDVIRMRDGTTVEVLNTDAEGRLVLGDGLAHAVELGADTVIDIATLTGAVIVALGDLIGGVMANDDALAAELIATGRANGEPLWQLPLAIDEYGKRVEGTFADLRNVGSGKDPGTVFGALFLARFVPDRVRWAHLDIAGIAWRDTPSPYHQKGGTGSPVRTLIAWLEGLSRG